MKDIRLPYAWQDLFMPDPAFSPALSRDPQILPAANAADGDVKTAWASKGTGAVLWLFVDPGAPSLRLVNGYGKSARLFAANNRVRKLLVSVWTAEHFEGDVTEKIRLWKAARLTPDLRLELKDTRDPQEFSFPFNWEELRFKKAEAASALMKRAGYRGRTRLYSSFVLRVEPAEVYRGSRYDDTCVSEISAGDSWLNEAAIPGRWERPYGKTAEVLALSAPPERAYSLKRGETPLSSGRWRAEDGDLVLEHGAGAERYSASAENRRGRRTLRLVAADGTILIYRAPH
ncbi:MAG: hypothetical protein RQ748_12885, partial [Elusimicrobiales bacterium]|nr:hypothetical protein [Elusimicrobiales bacterium]